MNRADGIDVRAHERVEGVDSSRACMERREKGAGVWGCDGWVIGWVVSRLVDLGKLSWLVSGAMRRDPCRRVEGSRVCCEGW